MRPADVVHVAGGCGMMAENVDVLTCEWVPTGEFDRHGKPYNRCAKCGRRWAFYTLAALVACGRKGGVVVAGAARVVVISECTGCGEKSTAAKKESRPIPVDYPGAADE